GMFPPSRAERREARRAARDEKRSVPERLHAFRSHLVAFGAMSALLLGINYLTSDGFWWALFPVLGMGIARASEFGKLWADGIPLKSVFTGALPAAVGTVALSTPDAPTSDIKVLAGPHDAALKQAISDNARVQDSIARLSETERKMLPDVKATADALFGRIHGLAPALDRLDVEIGTDRAKSLDERIAQIESQTGDATDRERRLNLLRRQREMVADLVTQRGKLVEQYESACLLLQNLALDLLKVRSSGLDSALGGITSATQEARALSREIGYVLNAADELRDLDAGR
ncbi:MAG: 2TM domain-containing protein, partial [Gemmatimonadaceae bacterium]